MCVGMTSLGAFENLSFFTSFTCCFVGYSNIGSCVDIAAPGISIKSAMNTGIDATATWQGTSMAAPHVTGVVAQILQDHPDHTPAQVKDVLTMNAKEGGVAGVRRSRHLVLKGETQNKHDAVRRRLPKGGNTGGGNPSVLPNNFLLQTHRGDGDQCISGGDSPPPPTPPPTPPGSDGASTPPECGTVKKNAACTINTDCISCNCKNNDRCG